MVDEQLQVFEGSRSNVFWVKNSDVYTRGSGVLEGITRGLVLENVPDKVEFDNIDLESLKNADEVFMSGSTVGVYPVSKIDDTIIGNGEPGPLTQAIRTRLKKYYY